MNKKEASKEQIKQIAFKLKWKMKHLPAINSRYFQFFIIIIFLYNK